ncbi:MAG TPA: DUF4080 domain-containing protein [Candidatus Limnocylindria bacterium]|nr:DUF4080 domain-containing protein [Candidatus Limnocylindria bacterium]
MPEILLSTLNAKFIHSAFGLRYLLANMGELRSRSAIAEFDINQRPVDIAEVILAQNPRILGLGVYIWNVAATTELVTILKRVRPEMLIVLGGPEVSFECDRQEIIRLADYTITGEADLKFAEICQLLLNGGKPALKIIPAELPDVTQLALPYSEYDGRDCAHRVIYVEASRGCPFTCEFCLSSLEVPVRQFALEPFLAAMQSLLDRGVKHFKFVDRTFNLNLATSRRILEFFLERWTDGLFVHFEMVPDRLPEQLREIIARFPAGSLQFEVGIQTFNLEVEKLISRRQNHDRLNENFRWLRSASGVHIHADLIAGLPGEDLASFGAGFDRMIGLRPQEIQVGILKRLRGTPIIRHDAAWGMVYSAHPPYEVLQTKTMDFATLGRLRRFAKFWDIFGNSGNFRQTLSWLWERPASMENPASPFWNLLEFSDWLHGEGVKTSGVALGRQYELLYAFLTRVRILDTSEVKAALADDYLKAGRNDLPPWLTEKKPMRESNVPESAGHFPKRQQRHLAS